MLNDVILFILILDLKNKSNLSYKININTKKIFQTNVLEKFKLSQEKDVYIPILNDLNTIKQLFPNENSIYSTITSNENLSIIAISNIEYLIALGKNILNILHGKSEQENIDLYKQQIKDYCENIFERKSATAIHNILNEMQPGLEKYSSLIACFDLTHNELIASTLEINKEENQLAKEVYLELVRLNKFDNTDLEEFEVKLLKLGSDVQCFFFVFKNIAFIIYAISINVNTGIIRLKLRTWIKNNLNLFKEISSSELDYDNQKSIKIENVSMNFPYKIVDLRVNYYDL